MKKIKITQIKSGIDRPERQKLTLRALGLNKMNASREVEATAQILGMVRAVNHLIRIEETEEGDTLEAVSAMETRVQESKKKIISQASTNSAAELAIPAAASNEVEQPAVTPVLPEELVAQVSNVTKEEPAKEAVVEEPASEVFPEDPSADASEEKPGASISPEEPIK
ncbi:MAG: 50S ribosomal protein L30 [Chitinophagaceae bacterium]